MATHSSLFSERPRRNLRTRHPPVNPLPQGPTRGPYPECDTRGSRAALAPPPVENVARCAADLARCQALREASRVAPRLPVQVLDRVCGAQQIARKASHPSRVLGGRQATGDTCTGRPGQYLPRRCSWARSKKAGQRGSGPTIRSPESPSPAPRLRRWSPFPTMASRRGHRQGPRGDRHASSLTVAAQLHRCRRRRNSPEIGDLT